MPFDLFALYGFFYLGYIYIYDVDFVTAGNKFSICDV